MSPKVGFRPTHPHSAAGMRTLPPVSLPVAAATSRAATAAADPPLDPPAIRDRSCGLCVVPKNGLIVVTPPPSSWVLVLPRSTVPASVRRATTAASCSGIQRSCRRDPPVVRMPRVAKRSLCAIGTPASGPGRAPALHRVMTRRVSSTARSRVTVTKAPSAGSLAVDAGEIGGGDVDGRQPAGGKGVGEPGDRERRRRRRGPARPLGERRVLPAARRPGDSAGRTAGQPFASRHAGPKKCLPGPRICHGPARKPAQRLATRHAQRCPPHRCSSFPLSSRGPRVADREGIHGVLTLS